MTTTNSKLMAYDTIKKSFDYLKSENGILSVSSSGGGSGGDASASNQLLQISEAQTTNNRLNTIASNLNIVKTELQASLIVQEAINQKIDIRVIKCDTDNVVIDSTDPVQTVLLAKVENTDNNAYLVLDDSQNLKVSVSNQNDISTLATEATQAEIKTQLDKLTFTNDKLKVIQEPLVVSEPAFLDFDQNSEQVTGDSPVGCWYNPNDEVEGWGYSNLTVGGAQVYYYTNTGLVANAAEGNITLGSVTSGFCVASLNTITTTDNTWIMGIYTKPTGSGDAQPWYKSRKSYQVTSSFPISKGVDYLFYWGTNPTTIHPELQHVEMSLASTQGTAAPSEIVQFMSLNVPSTVPQFQFVGRVKRAGYVRSGVAREVHFLNSNGVRAEKRLHQLKFDTLVENIGQGALFVNVENQLTDYSLESTQLIIKDELISSNSLTTDIVNELQSINSNVAKDATSILIKEELITLNNKNLALDDSLLSIDANILQGNDKLDLLVTNSDKFYFNGNNELLVSSNGSAGYPDVNIKCNDVLLTQTTDGVKNCLDIQVNNQLDISGLSTETTLGLVNTELTTLNGTMADLISGDAQMYVKIDGSDDSIQILGIDSTSLAPSAIYSVDNAAKVYVDNVPNVLLLAKNSVDNNVSLLVDGDERLLCNTVVFGQVSVIGDFYQASQPVEGTVSANIKSNDIPITFTQTSENQYSLDVSVNNASLPVTGTFFQETQPVYIDKLSFTAEDELIVYDNYSFQELQSLNGKVTKCDTDNITVLNQISGFATETTLSSLNGKVTKCDTDNVNVTNMVDVSSLATESTLNSIKTQTDKFTYISKDGNNALLVKVDNQLSQPFTVSGDIKIQDANGAYVNSINVDGVGTAFGSALCAYDLANDQWRSVRMSETSALYIEANPGTTIPVSGTFWQTTQPVSGIVDSHMYANGSGGSMHLVSCDNQGKLNICMHDNDGNGLTSSAINSFRALDVSCKGNVAVNLATLASGSLTSASVTGTDTYNALHVVTKGTTTIAGTVKTQSQDSNNSQIANNISVVGPVRIGNTDADTQGYLWVSAIFSFTSVTSGGQIYLEVSHDGNIWARPTSASTFIMTSMAQVTGSIILSTPCPFRYSRLYADNGFNGSGCYAWIVMK